MDFIAAGDAEEPYDLEEALAEHGRLAPETVKSLLMQVCDGLAYAHGEGVVHRDLKPANILLTSRDLDKAQAKVGDFGLARVIGEENVRSMVARSVQASMSIGELDTVAEKPRTERSSTGSVLGTYGYMSPEQEEGRAADERSDIYALGVMIYRMVTGQKPRAMAKPPSRVVDGLDSAWDDIVEQCLELEPEERWQNLGELMGALDGIGDRRPASASEDLLPEQAVLVGEETKPPTSQRHKTDKTKKKTYKKPTETPKVAPEKPLQDAKTESEPYKKFGAGKVAAAAVMIAIVALGVFFAVRDDSSTPDRPAVEPTPEISERQEENRESREETRSQEHIEQTESATEPDPGDTMTVDLGGGVEMDFVWIPPGDYMRGGRLSPEETAERYGGRAEWYEREHPRHRVRLTEGFWMGKTPVTQAQWGAIMNTSLQEQRSKADFDYGICGEGNNHPMYYVSWNDAVEYAEKLSEQAEGMFRLPTEAEWEYACRAGTETEFYFGDDAGDLGDYAWYRGNSSSRTHPVGQKRPNAWGLHDMHGNVREWCQDWFGEYPSGTVTDPTGPRSGEYRVLRGGSWYGNPRYCRSANRLRGTPGYRINFNGFRVVLDE